MFGGNALGQLGDWHSCLNVADSDYVVLVLSGSMSDQLEPPKRSVGLFFPEMTDLIGQCAPKGCSSSNLIKEITQAQEHLAGFVGMEVEVYAQPHGEVHEQAIFVSLYYYMVGSIFMIVIAGTAIEISKFGNRHDLTTSIEDPAAPYNLQYKDMNRRNLLSKQRWTYPLLAFSMNRNMYLNVFKSDKKMHEVTIDKPIDDADCKLPKQPSIAAALAMKRIS